jgi:membrane fusion protein, multidrug efflux system
MSKTQSICAFLGAGLLCSIVAVEQWPKIRLSTESGPEATYEKDRTRSATRVYGWNSANQPLPQDGEQMGAGSVSDGNRVRAVVKSQQNVTLGSELNARIVKLALRDGDRFKQGDILVQFDCERIQAEWAAALAVHEGHKISYKQNVQLLKFKAGGSTAVELAKFEMLKSEADLRNLDAKRATCLIVAPFNGRVVEKLAQEHEVATPNQPLLKIVDDSLPELVLMVPSHWIGHIAAGTEFWLKVDETGQRHRAVVSQIGGAIDPVSQSVRLVGTIKAKSGTVLAGMSGTADFSADGGKQ